MPDYQHLTDDEVLQIANERDQLTDDARVVLDSELVRRKLSIKDVYSQKLAYVRAEKLERARTQHRIINRGSFDSSGIGFGFRGKRNLRRDPQGRFEEYESTRWFIILWLPVYPIATFTVHRTLSRGLGIVFKSDPQPIERHPRNWEQILLTWVKAAAVLLAMRLAWTLLIHRK